jgi:hypothetical protein
VSKSRFGELKSLEKYWPIKLWFLFVFMLLGILLRIKKCQFFVLQILLGWRRRFLCSRFDMQKLPHWYQILGLSCMTWGNTNLILSVPVCLGPWVNSSWKTVSDPLISGPDWYDSFKKVPNKLQVQGRGFQSCLLSSHKDIEPTFKD